MAGDGMDRRGFLKMTAGGALGLFVINAVGLPELVHAAPIPGGALTPGQVPKFVTPLVIPPAMPPSNGTPDVYDIAVKQFQQQILPTGFGATRVWSYGAAGDLAKTLNYPAFTIEASRGTPVTVTWINGLAEGGAYLPHLLPVDQTLHWANPPGGTAGRDTRPAFTTTPGPYTGPVPIATHVHGMERVPDWSDGYAEAWYLPAGIDPDEYATVGTWYEFFAGKAADAGLPWAEGSATSLYPNSQRPSTLWYHDHTLGMTRVNVYAGPAGFYLIRSNDPDDNPRDALTGQSAVLPGPAPAVGDGGGPYYEIPLAIQDRSFGTDGSLFYPDSRVFFDAFPGPYIPDSDVSPIWNPEFFGNMMLVNGNTWPYLDVEPRRYRLRLLNGCNSRFLLLELKDLVGRSPRPEVWQIGNEGGFLRAPVRQRQLLMAPAERADVIVDFTNVPPGTTITMINNGPDAPFGGGGFRVADPQSTGLVMTFRVGQLQSQDASTPPAQLLMPSAPAITGVTNTRHLALIEKMAAPPQPAIPVEALLGTYDTQVAGVNPATGLPNGVVAREWMGEVTETPQAFATEAWEIYNFTADAHPIHIHETFFEVVDRQRLDAKTGLPTKRPRPPEAWENGYKDTVIAYPGEVTRVRMTFGPGGQYVWHCHIVEHEDNEMMRPYRIGAEQPNQPGST